MCTNAVPQAQGSEKFDPLHAITNAQQSLIKLTFEILDGVMDGTVVDVTAPLIAQLWLPSDKLQVDAFSDQIFSNWVASENQYLQTILK